MPYAGWHNDRPGDAVWCEGGFMAVSIEVEQFIRRMPKSELHVHLEGSVRPRTLFELAERHGIALAAKDEAALKEFYSFRDFDHFIEIYIEVNRCLRTSEDFALITRELGEEASEQNIRYLEVTISPGPHVRNGKLTYEEFHEGISDGAREARERWGVEMRFVVDVVRGAGMETSWAAARYAVEKAGDGIVGIGLGGTEAGYPPEDYVDIFDYGLAAGLRSTPHAGETVGPASIWGAIRALKAERIGHGIRAIEDPLLVEELRDRQITLEVCPTSNVCTRAVASLGEHPIRRLFEAGVPVTVNSDDPPMFGTTLLDEQLLLANAFEFSIDDIEKLNLQGITAAFLAEADRRRLETEFRDEYARLRAELGLPSAR
jgi:adenosine deaminase